MAKKVGEIRYKWMKQKQMSSKPIWGDVFKGDEDSDVEVWGIIYAHIPPYDWTEAVQRAIREFNGEDGKGIEVEGMKYPLRWKDKMKSSKWGDKHKVYICRPLNEMPKVLEVINGFKWEEGAERDVEVDVTGEWSDVRKHQIADVI